VSQRPLGRLTAKLRAKRLFGATPLGLELRPLEIHPGAIAIESLLQGRDDNSGETGLELTKHPRCARFVVGRGASEASGQLSQVAHGVQHLHPLVERHEISLCQVAKKCSGEWSKT
jgi:hypothetical protein